MVGEGCSDRGRRKGVNVRGYGGLRLTYQEYQQATHGVVSRYRSIAGMEGVGMFKRMSQRFELHKWVRYIRSDHFRS